jgi:hypothetical protein
MTLTFNANLAIANADEFSLKHKNVDSNNEPISTNSGADTIFISSGVDK